MLVYITVKKCALQNVNVKNDMGIAGYSHARVALIVNILPEWNSQVSHKYHIDPLQVDTPLQGSLNSCPPLSFFIEDPAFSTWQAH